MKRVFAQLSAPLLLSLIAVSAYAAADTQPMPREVSVTGEGRVVAAPDEVGVSLAVHARSANLQSARADVNKRTVALLDFLSGLDLKPGNVNATGIDLRPQYRWNKESGEQELTGYLVQRTIDVRLTDLEKLGTLIEGGLDAGANQVSPPVLGHSREASLRRKALAAATLDAHANARAIAESLGASVGRARSVSVLHQMRPKTMASEMMMRSDAAPSAPAGFVAGDLVFENSLNATFDLEFGDANH